MYIFFRTPDGQLFDNMGDMSKYHKILNVTTHQTSASQKNSEISAIFASRSRDMNTRDIGDNGDTASSLSEPEPRNFF